VPFEPAQETGFARALAGQMKDEAQTEKPDLLIFNHLN
jgi:hypothetical protein